MSVAVAHEQAQVNATEIAVLTVQLKHVEDRVVDIKDELKDIRFSIDRAGESAETQITELKHASETAHEALSLKINALEKWRWMMMGAGVLIGSVGFEGITHFLKFMTKV